MKHQGISMELYQHMDEYFNISGIYLKLLIVLSIILPDSVEICDALSYNISIDEGSPASMYI